MNGISVSDIVSCIFQIFLIKFIHWNRWNIPFDYFSINVLHFEILTSQKGFVELLSCLSTCVKHSGKIMEFRARHIQILTLPTYS